MQTQNNTILITGGGSGIGLGLAQEFKKLGNTVIIAGRTGAKLEAAAKIGFHTRALDVSSVENTTTFVKKSQPTFLSSMS